LAKLDELVQLIKVSILFTDAEMNAAAEAYINASKNKTKKRH
jgi:hypothetical protein